MKHLTDHTAARQTSLFRQIDWFTTLIPFLCILALCAWFVISPESSTNTISAIRNFLGDEMGSYYLIIGLGVFVCSLYIAFSRFGKIRLGGDKFNEFSLVHFRLPWLCLCRLLCTGTDGLTDALPYACGAFYNTQNQ